MSQGFFDRVKVVTATAGAGTITLGAAVTGFRVMPAAADGFTVSYTIEDAAGAWEVGKGVYTHSGATLTRAAVEASSNAGSAIVLVGPTTVYVTVSAADMAIKWKGKSYSPTEAFFPATNYAQLAARNNHPLLAFDQTTVETAYFPLWLPPEYSGGGLVVDIVWMAVPTSGNVGWNVAIEALVAQDADSDGFASDNAVAGVAVNGTSGIYTKSSVTITSGANMDSIVAGQFGRLRLKRDTGVASNAAGDAQLMNLFVREA